jgi:hypothetical protein
MRPQRFVDGPAMPINLRMQRWCPSFIIRDSARLSASHARVQADPVQLYRDHSQKRTALQVVDRTPTGF